MPSLRRFVNLENIQRRDQLAIARHDTFWGPIVVQVQRLFYGVDPDSHPLTDEQFTLAPAHNIIVSVSFHSELYPSFATYFKNNRICHSSLEILNHIGISTLSPFFVSFLTSIQSFVPNGFCPLSKTTVTYSWSVGISSPLANLPAALISAKVCS